ncbi:hypothetical protein EYC80_003783 [Monilinia laxa]|uniref:Uncharacterized protein n=1 Tax=Monilinia laxa TaxID=61186 RepID=A0A5N6KL36_MONLA|nr:hypothetical protein EYC80_003783 [Monilinia laxa]
MSRSHTSNADGKQYFLITNVTTPSNENTEFDLQAEAWRFPYSIDDSDLTFDGTPLNMLYEENRYMAEGHVTSPSHETKSQDKYRGRGRSRCVAFSSEKPAPISCLKLKTTYAKSVHGIQLLEYYSFSFGSQNPMFLLRSREHFCPHQTAVKYHCPQGKIPNFCRKSCIITIEHCCSCLGRQADRKPRVCHPSSIATPTLLNGPKYKLRERNQQDIVHVMAVNLDQSSPRRRNPKSKQCRSEVDFTTDAEFCFMKYVAYRLITSSISYLPVLSTNRYFNNTPPSTNMGSFSRVGCKVASGH